MANGLTEQQMLERLYVEMVGLDGQSGMVAEHRQMKSEVDEITHKMVTKDDCAQTRRAAGNRRDKLLLRLKDIILMVVALAGLLLGSGILRR